VKYKQFVEALPPFVAEARTLLNKPRLHRDDQFRNWRHRLTDLLKRVSEEGYMVNCDIENRSFDLRAGYGSSPSDSARLALTIASCKIQLSNSKRLRIITLLLANQNAVCLHSSTQKKSLWGGYGTMRPPVYGAGFVVY
jgi:hypothetical protein